MAHGRATRRGSRVLQGTAVALALFALFAAGGCASNAPVEWTVEETTAKAGANLTSLRNEILKDVKRDIEIWIRSPERIEEAFTGTALNEFRAARALDRREGVRVVRVHRNQNFKVIDENDGVRPYVEYRFLDMSYYVDAKTGKRKAGPFEKQRTISIYLVRNDGVFKIDNMVGNEQALR